MPVGDYRSPAEQGGTFEGYDQGIDWRGPVGSPVVAIGGGHVDRISLNAGGFGEAVYYHLTEGPGKGTEIYIGHATPLVQQGQPLQPGEPVAELRQTPFGNAPGDPGHTEVGIARPDAQGPMYPLGSNTGGYAFATKLSEWGIENDNGVNPYGSAVHSGVAGSPPPPSTAPPPPSGSPGNGKACSVTLQSPECEQAGGVFHPPDIKANAAVAFTANGVLGWCECGGSSGSGSSSGSDGGGILGDIGSIVDSILGGTLDIGGVFKEAAIRMGEFAIGLFLVFIGIRGLVALR